MKEKVISQELIVKDNLISVIKVGHMDYISLTDLARYKNAYCPGDVIIKWMSNKSSFDFYCLWEELFNENFKLAKSREFKKACAEQSFTMSPSRWINNTNAIGFISRRGKYYGGTYAHPDIALEFASWIDPAFKLYLIKEFERLKEIEARKNNAEWSIRRSLSKTNYKIHTASIKESLVPSLTSKQRQQIYADEADIINVALFGLTAKKWRNLHPNMAGNMRDYANILQLIILSNLEVLNAEMIEEQIEQKVRLERLNKIAIKQMSIMVNDKNISEIMESDHYFKGIK